MHSSPAHPYRRLVAALCLGLVLPLAAAEPANDDEAGAEVTVTMVQLRGAEPITGILIEETETELHLRVLSEAGEELDEPEERHIAKRHVIAVAHRQVPRDELAGDGIPAAPGHADSGSDAKADPDRVAAEREKLEKRLALREEKLADRRARADELASELAGQESELAAKRQEYETVKAEADRKQREVNRLSGQITRDARDGYRVRNDDRNRMNKLSREVTELRKQEKELKRSIPRLEAEIESTKGSVKRNASAIERYERSVARYKEEIAALE